MPISYAYEIDNPGSGGYTFSPVCINNDAGYAYNLSGITFVTTLVNLTGTFEYNSTERGTQQVVAYYIALGFYNPQYGSFYIQPVIMFVAYDTNAWVLEWYVQAWGNTNDNEAPQREANYYGFITGGSGSSVYLNCLFNLTIKATLNSQGEITSAWVYIANAKTPHIVYFNQTVNLKYPIPDKQVFFTVEDPLTENFTPYNFPIIPSSNYIFVHALASNSSNIYGALPLYNGVESIMTPLAVPAYVVPTLDYSTGTQGVHYYW